MFDLLPASMKITASLSLLVSGLNNAGLNAGEGRGAATARGREQVAGGIAPNWGSEQGLSWSGTWHALSLAGGGLGQTLCGAYVYATPDRVPQYYRRLQRISAGLGREAPVCAKCEHARQQRGWL